MSPEWLRLRCGDIELTNALNWLEWSRNPVQVILCEVCGQEGCASGEYVHVSRLAEYAVWTAPQATCTPASSLATHGAIAFAAEQWSELRSASPGMPELRSLPRANGRALLDAWILGPGRPIDARDIVEFLGKRLLGGDTLETGDAIALVQRTLDVFAAYSQEGREPKLASITSLGARLERLYFDGPSEVDWAAFAVIGSQFVPALTTDLALL